MFSKRYLPETKGRSLEQLEEAFRTHSEHCIDGASKKIITIFLNYTKESAY